MKKLIALLAALLVLAGCSTAPATDAGTPDNNEVDTVSTPSTAFAFANFALDGDDLMNSINETGGVTGIMTSDEDGTPNIGLFGYDMIKQDDQYIICVHMMTNQTSSNIDNGSEVVILFANMEDAYNDEGRMLSTTGARIYVKVMEDQEAAEKLCTDIGLKKAENGHLYAFIVEEVIPLG